MNKLLLNAVWILIVFALFGCSEEHEYPTGGPYYYKSDVTDNQPFRPSDEITGSEADKLGSSGYTYYIVYFNDDRQPTIIEKRFRGMIIRKNELFYKNGKLFKSVTTDGKGNKETRDYKGK